jgi:AraC family transcriptional regulator
MQVAGRGEIEVWEGGSLWVLSAASETAQTAAHSHHAIQVTFSLEGWTELHSSTQRMTDAVVAVAAGTDHIFTASGRVAFLFIEPESEAGRSMAPLFDRGSLAALDANHATELAEELRVQVRAGSGSGGLSEIGRRLVDRIASTSLGKPLDPRVQAMITFASENLDGPLSLLRATSHIGLSPSRLRHLFVKQTGLAFKTYLLWLRIRRALELYSEGATLTDAAHGAGFADSSHFSRTFRRTFGVPAASLQLSRSPSDLDRTGA